MSSAIDMLPDTHRKNLPFCLFFKLVRVCNLAPSRGANGWRTIVAMVDIVQVLL